MNEAINYIKKNPVIAVMRGLDPDTLMHAASALYAGGVRVMEVTFDQTADASATANAIKSLSEYFDGEVYVGAGTVMSKEQVEIAHKAGARFIVSPNTDEAVVKRTRELGLMSMPGAFTPTEIAYAYSLGADIVKIFPAGVLGSDYIKAIKAPLKHIPIAAVGGITPDNIPGFLSAGVCCFGLSTKIMPEALLKAKAFDDIEELARTYVRACADS